MTEVVVKRIYQAAAASDGCRVLVDRLWPRGLKKDAACLDRWLRDLAPSDALRKWFGHEPAKWDEFRRRYFAELDTKTEALAQLRALLEHHDKVTLLYSAKDEAHNNAVALAEYLRGRRGR